MGKYNYNFVFQHWMVLVSKALKLQWTLTRSEETSTKKKQLWYPHSGSITLCTRGYKQHQMIISSLTNVPVNVVNPTYLPAQRSSGSPDNHHHGTWFLPKFPGLLNKETLMFSMKLLRQTQNLIGALPEIDWEDLDWTWTPFRNVLFYYYLNISLFHHTWLDWLCWFWIYSNL